MKPEKKKTPERRILVTLIVYLAVILLSMILGATHQIAGWVAQFAIVLALCRLVFIFGWHVARSGKGWRM